MLPFHLGGIFFIPYIYMKIYKMKKLTFLLLSVVIMASCNVINHEPQNHKNDKSVDTESLKSVLYIQTAAEYRALCYQTFNYAKLQLDNYLKRMNMSKRYAIVVDIDETVLDNSPHAAQSILDATNYPVGWTEWINRADAKPIPGSLEFLNYASKNGVDVFYISNRKDELRKPTLVNLRETGFPNVEDKFLLLRTSISGKEPRREIVKETHEIIMLFGDNLNDFLPVFEKKGINERFDLVDKYEKEFGSIFFMLPNPSYGDWEGAVYNYDYSLSEKEKMNYKKEALIGFTTK